MPLGWYLAQGLIPLGPSSSDDEEGPCELPNGQLVCGPHGFVSCGKCCVDYSFMDDEDAESLGSDIEATATENSQLPASLLGSFGLRLKRGTGRVFPTKFAPPSSSITPVELFSGRKIYGRITRQVNA